MSRMPRKDHERIAGEGRISEGAACVILDISRTTMRRWRARGYGPEHRFEHKRLISYDRKSVEDFAAKLNEIATDIKAAA